MSDNKKYYYLKLKDNFFDSDEIIILESMPDGILYSNILLKLYLKSVKSDGKLMFNEKIPYNATILAQLTRHTIGTIEKALHIFEELGLVEILDNGAIFMMDIQNFIGESSTEADRKREYRKKVESEKSILLGQMSDECPDNSPPEIEIEIEIEKELKIEKEKDIDLKELSSEAKPNYSLIVDLYNQTCTSLPTCKKLTEARKKLIRCRLEDYSEGDLLKAFELAEYSDFLSGRNGKWTGASIDWILNVNNIQKILEGNYKNKKAVTSKIDWSKV